MTDMSVDVYKRQFIGTNQGVYFVHKEKTKDLEMFSSMKFLKGTAVSYTHL